MRGEVFRSELRALFRLAVPLAAAQAGTQLMGLVDVAVLGRLGARELAGSGLANAVFFGRPVVALTGGVVMGLVAVPYARSVPSRKAMRRWSSSVHETRNNLSPTKSRGS